MNSLLSVFDRGIIGILFKDPAKIGDTFKISLFDDLQLGQIGCQQEKLGRFNPFSDNEFTWSNTDN